MSDSIERNNRFARNGEDEDFGKGSTEFDRHNGDPGHAPNPCLGPIATPPFYAMAVYPSTLGTTSARAPTATIPASASLSDRPWCSPGAPR